MSISKTTHNTTLPRSWTTYEYSVCCTAPQNNDTSKRCATWNTRSRQGTPSVISTPGADWGNTFTSCDVDCDDAWLREVARREAGTISRGLQTRCQRSPPQAQDTWRISTCRFLDQQTQGRENFQNQVIRAFKINSELHSIMFQNRRGYWSTCSKYEVEDTAV
jgi:hypothetical protein